MNLRNHVQTLAERGDLIVIAEPISTQYEIAAVLKKLEPSPVLFENIKESHFRVIGNLLCSKTQFVDYFGMRVADLIPTLMHAIESPSSPAQGNTAPCQEIVHLNPNLESLPIPVHYPGDGGPFITAGVMITTHPTYGQNMDFHRCMQFSPTEMAVRVVKGRHFDAYLQDLGQVEVAVCVGNTPNVMAAGAISVEMGLDELTIANTLEPLRVVKAKTVDLMIPAEAEFVLEGIVYRDRRHAEGPFVDLTGTQDVVRVEPVFEVRAITHRTDAIWQALLPGSLEHKLLMGMPREPTIFRKVNQVVRCLDVNLNPGGCSWLHAIVQIDKQAQDDGVKAIQAAFAGHRSCKHIFVVDKDINIYDPLEVEWAMATRFQGDRDMILLPREPGSSLDPSAEAGTKLTTKIGFDLTAPLGEARNHYEKVPYPNINLEKFIR
jgi:2,5-furandicarboxylate decarboxylase 1